MTGYCSWWQQNCPAILVVTLWTGGGAGRQSPGHFRALAWPASPTWVGLLTWLPVLGTPTRQLFWEGCCLTEKCVPGPPPDRPSCPQLRLWSSRGQWLPREAPAAPACGAAGFFCTCLLSWGCPHPVCWSGPHPPFVLFVVGSGKGSRSLYTLWAQEAPPHSLPDCCGLRHFKARLPRIIRAS